MMILRHHLPGGWLRSVEDLWFSQIQTEKGRARRQIRLVCCSEPACLERVASKRISTPAEMPNMSLARSSGEFVKNKSETPCAFDTRTAFQAARRS
jgi:hypothetical protein